MLEYDLLYIEVLTESQNTGLMLEYDLLYIEVLTESQNTGINVRI